MAIAAIYAENSALNHRMRLMSAAKVSVTVEWAPG